ncbi:MAG: S-layer homology domain-containing protein [Defluviitaleaceae bacterium]|nr:S-layer homology domain-containing protein [Defluviitaleaceae bacterium]
MKTTKQRLLALTLALMMIMGSSIELLADYGSGYVPIMPLSVASETDLNAALLAAAGSGGTVSTTGSFSISGVVLISNNVTLEIQSGHTITINSGGSIIAQANGSAILNHGSIMNNGYMGIASNSGGLVNEGTITNHGTIDSTHTLTNNGTIINAGTIMGSGAITGSGTIQSVPPVPGGLVATAGDGQVTLIWTAPLNDGNSPIIRYEVSSDGGSTWTSAGLNLTHTFTGLTNGTSYHFTVRAVNSVGAGTAANVHATPAPPPVLLTAPQNFTATAGNGQATLNWENPANVAGNTIRFEVSSNNGSTWTDVSWNVFTHTFTGLTNGTEYHFRVRAVNPAGFGAEATASATPSLPAHGITVNGGTANHTTAIQGQVVTLTAGTAPAGQQFANWTTTTVGVTITNPTQANGATFTMPNHAVVITANFELIPPVTWTVTFNLANGTYAGNQTLLSQTIVSGGNSTGLTRTPTRSGFNFNGWQPPLNLNNVTENRTFTAQWTAQSNPDDSNSSNSDNDNPSRTHAQQPRITTPPQSVEVYVGGSATLFADIARITDGGAISYQWQRAEGAWGGTFRNISHATGRTFTPDTNIVGVNRYRVIVTNTNHSSSVDGNRESRVTSPSATVRVNAPTTADVVETVTSPPTSTAPAPSSPPPQPAIQPTPLPFGDVDPWAWYSPFVRIVWENQLFRGTSPDVFAPHDTMTRSMFIQVLANLDGVNLTPYSTTAPAFGDVESSAWYFAPVQWAVEQGIIHAQNNNALEPDRAITREDMAVLLHNFMMSNGMTIPQAQDTLTPFTDQVDISPWAVDAINMIQSAQIILGYPDGSFQPNNTATRAEVAAIFSRFLFLTM